MPLFERRTKTFFRVLLPGKVAVIAAAYILVHVVVGAMLIRAAITVHTTTQDEVKVE